MIRKRKYPYSTVLVFIEKNPLISGPAEFKSMLFLGQFCINSVLGAQSSTTITQQPVTFRILILVKKIYIAAAPVST